MQSPRSVLPLDKAWPMSLCDTAQPWYYPWYISPSVFLGFPAVLLHPQTGPLPPGGKMAANYFSLISLIQVHWVSMHLLSRGLSKASLCLCSSDWIKCPFLNQSVWPGSVILRAGGTPPALNGLRGGDGKGDFLEGNQSNGWWANRAQQKVYFSTK